MKKSEFKKLVNEIIDSSVNTKGSHKNAILVIALHKNGWNIQSVDSEEIIAEFENQKYALTIREIEE